MLEEVRDEVRKWSERVLEQSRDSLQDWSICPYAKGAWEANAARVVMVDDWRDVLQAIHGFINGKSAITILVKLEPDDWDMDDFLEDVFVLLFHLDELNIASKALEEDGFYNNWRPELYYEVLARRKLGDGKD
jgi:hypothetical protein